jgi:hypothetical protein
MKGRTMSTEEKMKALFAEVLEEGCLEDILMAAADAVAEKKGVRLEAVIIRVHYWVHCMQDKLDAEIRGSKERDEP